MFSVNNFYDFMNSHYGLDADGRNLFYIFQPHGTKNWKDLRPFYVDREKFIQIEANLASKGTIIFHDQEPFDRNILDTYKWYLVGEEKKCMWYINQSLEEILLFPGNPSLGWQIFCHSEYNSEDIRFADSAGSINCYYFYHGFIARDWFRHWKHHGRISPCKNWQHRFLLYARECTGTREYRKTLLNDLQSLRSMIDHDWDHSRNISSDASASISVQDSQSAAIHLVAETIFDRNKIHLTEKIFKPMVMMQPFIVFGGPGSLEYLKKYGFRTFDSVWDESYDQEKNHNARYEKVLKLIQNLASVSDHEINRILEKCRSIVEHNHRWFYSEDFEQRLLSELKTNMAHCLEHQAEKTKMYPGGVMVNQFEILRKRGEPLPAHHIEKFIGYMKNLQLQEPSRHNVILRQHPWLGNYLV